jgi:general L-amino acid transport system permease protein
MLLRSVKFLSRGEWLTLIFLIALASWLGLNLENNLSAQNIASGFSFLSQESGFEISESLLPFDSSKSYERALVMGAINTFKVSLLGICLSLVLGLSLCFALLATHPLINKLATAWSDLIRHTPLLLQLFFWYALLTDLLPPVRQAYSLFDLVYLSNRGLFYPIMGTINQFKFFLMAAITLLYLFVHFYRRSARHFYLTAKWKNPWPLASGFYVVSLFTVWLVLGMPRQFSIPELSGFNFQGGDFLSPEYSALLLGLVLYTGTFMADIFKAGIQSVPKGQWEAAYVLGLGTWDRMRLIILPQAMKVAIPPLTGQILNLVKNSSLAVAIAYPDFVSVSNTIMNQTGQAFELVLLIMLFYLTSSLVISFFMNRLNRRVVERGQADSRSGRAR